MLKIESYSSAFTVFSGERQFAATQVRSPFLAILALAFTSFASRIQAENIAAQIAPQQIVTQALAHSLQLQSLHKEVESAKAKQAQAKAQDLPRVTADARAAGYTGLKDSAFGPAFKIPAIENRYSAGISVTQPVYAGGRIQSLQQSATYQQRAAQQIERGAESDLILQALTAFWNWSKAYYSVEAMRAAVARMEAHATDLRNRRQAGLATDNETLAAEVLLDQTRLRFEEARRQVALACARLAFLTGKEFSENNVPQKAIVQPEFPIPSELALFAAAKTNRAEFLARQLEAKSAEAQVRGARADFFPHVSLTGRYEQARPNILNIPPRDRWEDDAFAGVTLSWNIFDWGLTKAKVAEATARSAQARLRLAQVEELIALEVREALINLQDARERVKVAERVEKSARRNLEVATDLWQNGLARHADVLDAHAQLIQTQTEMIAAHADLVLAQAVLDHAAGRLEKGR
jgi:outer membrane protein TolC